MARAIGLDDPLTSEELRFIDAFRQVPEGRLRDRLSTVLDQVFAFARSPGCSEAQADGVPCGSAESACDQCREAEAVLKDVARRLGAHR